MAEKNFKSLDSLQIVINTINEANNALSDKSRTIEQSAMPEVLSGALGAGAALSFAALYGLGTVGLSAAGLTSGLATAGALVGGGMAAGVFVLAAPVAALAAGGVGIAAAVKSKKLKDEKKRLLQECIKKNNQILEAIKTERNVDKDRIDYLEALNKTLQTWIRALKEDIA